MSYGYPGSGFPIQANYRDPSFKRMPNGGDAPMSSESQDAANGAGPKVTPGGDGAVLHERGSNASPAKNARVIFDK